MAFDGSGNYVVPAGTQGVSGAIIDSAKYNALLTDLQTALSKALLRDGQSAAQSNIPMGGFKFTNMSAGAANGDSVRFEQLRVHPAAAYTTPVAVAFSANLSIDASLSNVFTIGALTGNITAVTINSPGDGQTIMMRFIQDATGARTVATPGGGTQLIGGVDSRASTASWLILTYTALAGRWEGAWSQVTL